MTDRRNDNIGLVVFAGESFTQCPLTTDHTVLLNLLNEIEFGLIDDGTAIGLGLATSVNRLKDSESQSRVVILLTDGTNNRGRLLRLLLLKWPVHMGSGYTQLVLGLRNGSHSGTDTIWRKNAEYGC